MHISTLMTMNISSVDTVHNELVRLLECMHIWTPMSTQVLMFKDVLSDDSSYRPLIKGLLMTICALIDVKTSGLLTEWNIYHAQFLGI